MFRLQRSSDIVLEPLMEHAWESRAVLNPGVVREGDRVHMVYRAVEGDNLSTLGHALLDRESRVLERRATPLLCREHSYEKQGAEDPRLTWMGDCCYIVYTGFDGCVCRVCLASTKDFKRVEKHGVIIPDIWDKDALLFPGHVSEKIVLMHRIEPSIQLAKFESVDQLLAVDERYWADHLHHLDDHTILRPAQTWEAEKIGGGPPPILTREGWLLIYHGVDRDHIYRAGAALLDAEDPSRVISRLPDPILEPEKAYERQGDVPNVVFPEGVVEFEGKLHVYYGAADKVIGLAVAETDELVNELMKHKQ